MANLHAFIIPLMKPYRPVTNNISFAIDFGTTNTHIEYSFGNNVAKALDNSLESPFYQSLLDRNIKVNHPDSIYNEEIFYEKELMPFSLQMIRELFNSR